MASQQKQQVIKYANIVVKYKKAILIILFLAMSAGVGLYLKTPKVYQSTALIIYQQARINPGSKMAPDLNERTREIVATLSQQVTSRTSLENIIKQFGLYSKKRQKLPMEDVVDSMRKNAIAIKPERGDVFKVSFKGNQPKQVMQVANALAARFIEENLRYREEKATETSAYVEDELNMAKETLNKKEAAMRDYKLENYNEMPQQLSVNMGRLNALQDQLQNNQINIQELERTKILIQEQISLRKDALEALAEQMRTKNLQESIVIEGQAKSAAEVSPITRLLVEIQKQKDSLESLLLRYTEKHPEVKRAQKKLEQLESERLVLLKRIDGESTAESGASASGPKELKGPDRTKNDTQLGQLELQLREVNFNVKRLKEQQSEINEELAKYKKWIEMTPVREAEWTALTRDYKQLYDHYQALVAKNLEAASIESLERRQKGSQFKIVDSAFLPEKPFKPDFKKIMLLSLAVGLALGGGLVVVRGTLDTSFTDPDELETFLEVPLLCSIPLIVTPSEKKRERLKTIAWVLFFSCLSVAFFGGLVFLWKTGRIII